MLRRSLPKKTAIIYTVRTEPEGGQFPMEERAMFELLRIGGRSGCEIVDVESRWSKGHIETYLTTTMASHPHVSIVASTHAVQQPLSAYSDDALVRLYEDCARKFLFDNAALSTLVTCIKVVGRAEHMGASSRMHTAARKAWHGGESRAMSSLENICGVVAICTKQNGSLSRVLNASLGTTPVTSPLLKKAAAPGQITQKKIRETRTMLGLPNLKDSKQYYLFGTPIQTSPSPTMHNTGFLRLGLPHHYSLCDTQNIKDVQHILQTNKSFGGGSVTIPFKEKVGQYMNVLSDSAKAIGAVNTIIKDSVTGELTGDNTDWIGIRDAILTVVASSSSSVTLISGAVSGAVHPSSTAGTRFVPKHGLVIGAGGTARAAIYCLLQMGCQNITIHNRTYSKAKTLSKEFNVNAIEHLIDASIYDVVLSTVPASAGFTLPKGTWSSNTENKDTTGETKVSVEMFGPKVVLDAAYRPQETALLRQARMESAGKCLCVEGIDMLIAQGYGQLRRWVKTDDLTESVRQAIQKSVRSYYGKSNP